MKVASTEVVRLGVVVERKDIDNRWQDHSWRAAAVLINAPQMDDWKVLREGDGWTHFHARTLNLNLFRGETQGYKVNLSNPQPFVYVVLRPGEEAGEQDVEPFLVTACPYEAESYVESGDEIVDGVPMPPELIAMLHDFVDEHHVEVEFKKRKRKKAYDPTGDGFRRGPGEGGSDIH